MTITLTTSHIAKNIVVEYENKEQWHVVESALQKINSGPIGHELLVELRDISVRGKNIKITPNEIDTFIAPRLTMSQIKRFNVPYDEFDSYHSEIAESLARRDGLVSKGPGTSATVYWNPALSAGIKDDGHPFPILDPSISYVSLSHELIHAYHIVDGVYHGGIKDNNFDPASQNAIEEFKTVGLREYSSERFSENLIRLEHGLPFRQFYSIDPQDDF
ncbi:M91 family zinc metallopeptidase [Candidatus Pantoea floridensis]|uniref:Effector protein n=2 Tax=Pantoea TaxID=53335 RepID=A0A286BL57_9GAMM|nr:M91 family zinc metallopeptidase [Pantoea floridensis]PIF22270.1 NleD-like pathogen effector protein (putative zinc metallopeptidase) [Enterobacteriaceae bacterium JKS000233]SOD34909.1 Effector protein [Pantoea floridensis]